LQYLERKYAGGDIPEIRNVAEPNLREEVLAIENDAQNWDQRRLLSFFKELGEQKKTLDYALTMDLWEPEKDIPIASGGGLDVESTYENIVANIASEFGDEVLCTRKKAIFLIPNGHTEIEGKGLLLRYVTKDGLDYAGLYVIILPIGVKRLTVQIFTLYLSQSKDAKIEGQQALSLKQKSNPVHGRKIRAVRDIVLTTIDECANTVRDIYKD
jgi:hypothetical protein